MFTGRDINLGETVEVCPVVVFERDFNAPPELLGQRVFNWVVLASAPVGNHALALGYGSLYNHNNPANMRYEADAVSQLLRFIAVREIRVDEELTINYSAWAVALNGQTKIGLRE